MLLVYKYSLLLLVESPYSQFCNNMMYAYNYLPYIYMYNAHKIFCVASNINDVLFVLRARINNK